MKRFLKGAAALVIAIIVDIIINIICNTNGIELNSTVMSLVCAFCAIQLYHLFIRNEKNDDTGSEK